MTLDQFVDESIQRSVAAKYHPTTFMQMRKDLGTVGAIRKLVESSKPQSGFRRLADLGLLEWSLETAVLKFPAEFSRATAEYAKARLEGKLDA